MSSQWRIYGNSLHIAIQLYSVFLVVSHLTHSHSSKYEVIFVDIAIQYFYATNILLQIPKHSNLSNQIIKRFHHLEAW